MIAPAMPSPVRGFPLFLDLDDPSLLFAPPERLDVRPWLLVALPEAGISRDVTVGLEAIDFEVRHAKSATDVIWIVADTLASAGGHPPLCIILAGNLARSTVGLLDTLRRVGSTVPIVVCVDDASQRAAFAKRGAMALDAATALSIVAAAVGLPQRVCEKARRNSR